MKTKQQISTESVENASFPNENLQVREKDDTFAVSSANSTATTKIK